MLRSTGTTGRGLALAAASLAVVQLGALLSGCAPVVAPTRAPLTLRAPDWTGAAPALESADYVARLAELAGLALHLPADPAARVFRHAACVLRVERGDPQEAFVDGSRPFSLEVTWLDLSKVLQQEVGRTAPGKRRVTCAEVTGLPGMALTTEVVADARARTASRRFELLPLQRARLCVSGEVEAQRLASPLQQLVSICDAATPAWWQQEPRPITLEDRLLEHWEAGLGRALLARQREGSAAAALGAIARNEKAAKFLVERLTRSDSEDERRLAASLAGAVRAAAPAPSPVGGRDRTSSGEGARDGAWGAEEQRRLELFLELAAGR